MRAQETLGFIGFRVSFLFARVDGRNGEDNEKPYILEKIDRGLYRFNSSTSYKQPAGFGLVEQIGYVIWVLMVLKCWVEGP